MTTKMRTLRDFRNPIGCLILLAAFAAAAGCSTAESPSGSATNMNHVLPSGSSVAGWLVLPSGGTHASTATLDYIDGGGSSGCTQCHGSDLSGGISKVSCFGNPAGCHHTPVANWATPAVHGATAKKAPGSSGFASCQICHGKNFSGGGAQDCRAARTATASAAPHPARPWRGSTVTHTDTNTSNATVCAQCHFPGSPNNPANHPATPAPAGTAPGCFNSTLCHSEATVPHPVGNAWVTTSARGPAARERRESDAGRDHRVRLLPGLPRDRDELRRAAPRGSPATRATGRPPTRPMRRSGATGDTYVHTTTATGNAPVCAFCHLNGRELPDRAAEPARPGGNRARLLQQHAVPRRGWCSPPRGERVGCDASRGPAAREQCEGDAGHDRRVRLLPGLPRDRDDPSGQFRRRHVGGLLLNCHGNPHAPAPWRASAGSTYNHTNTDPGNAPICAQCHFPGSPTNPANHPPSPAPAGTPPGLLQQHPVPHGASRGTAPGPVQ